jgi:hypothetical protein
LNGTCELWLYLSEWLNGTAAAAAAAAAAGAENTLGSSDRFGIRPFTKKHHKQVRKAPTKARNRKTCTLETCLP